MISVEAKTASEQTSQWIKDGQRQLAVLLGVLSDYDRLLDVAEIAEQECKHLRVQLHGYERLPSLLATTKQECERLHDALKRLRTEIERYQREREEIADSFALFADTFSQFVKAILVRLRPETT